MTERPPAEDRRKDPRTQVHGAGRVWFGRHAARSAACILQDLSCSGARIESRAAAEFPQRIIFAHRGAPAIFLAVVKWRSGDVAGLHFSEGHPIEACVCPPLDRLAAEWTTLYADPATAPRS